MDSAFSSLPLTVPWLSSQSPTRFTMPDWRLIQEGFDFECKLLVIVASAKKTKQRPAQ